MKDSPSYKLQAWLAAIPYFGFFFVVFYAIGYIKKRKGYFTAFGYYFWLVIPVMLCFLIGGVIVAKVVHAYCATAWIIVTLDCCVFCIILIAAAYISLLIENIYIKKFVSTDTTE